MFRNFRGDLFGGLSSSIIALPLALAFGIVAFAPLGAHFASQGALACLYGAILTSFFASLFGGTPTQVTGPTAPMSVMIAAMIAAGLQSRGITELTPQTDLEPLLLPVFLAVFLGGFIQILLGASRGGRLIKYLPYPVIAGFMNGIALIIFTGQVKPFLGLGRHQSLWDILAGAVGPSWIAVAVGSVTVLTVILTPRLTKVIPGALTGMIAGLGCYLLVGWMARPELLSVEGNPFIIGQIPATPPTPSMGVQFFQVIRDLSPTAWLAILMPAFTLAMLGSIDSLLTSLVADVVTKTRHNSNQELMGQGIGNMIASVFGGLPGAGSTVRTLANFQNGGRTRLSGMICGLTLFMILVFLGKYARYIPYAVLAGILMVTSARMMDTWSFGLIRRRSTLRDMAIVVLVAGTTLLVDLMIAVGLGVVITVILFIRDQVKRSVIKDRVSGRRARSKKVRATDELEYLRMKGHKILVYTLEGTIFFGTADGMMQAIEKDAADAEVVILDLRLVQEIDLTGVQILRQLDDHMKEQDKLLLLSYVTDAEGHGHGPIAGFLSDVGLLEQMGPERLFEDTDRALEWAEDHLLQRAYGQSGDYSRRIDLRDMKIFQYLSDREIAYLAKILTHSEYKTGDIIFEEGDAGNTMYLVSSGSVSILLEIGKGERKKRVASFGRGVFFGEMALLENKPRSATAMAEEETGLYVLKREDFFRLLDKKPKIASKIQVGIARELSGRLRATDEELRALEM